MSGARGRHVESQQRVMSSRRLRITLGVFIATIVMAISGLTLLLVSGVFARLTPALRDDLDHKARLGAHDAAQASEYGIVLADREIIRAAVAAYTEPELIALVVTDEAGHVLVAEGAAIDVPALFLGQPNNVRTLPAGLGQHAERRL